MDWCGKCLIQPVLAVTCNGGYSVGVWWEVCWRPQSKCWNNLASGIKGARTHVCVAFFVHFTLHPRFFTSQAKISKQRTHSITLSFPFFPQTRLLHVSPSLLIYFSPFCLPSLQCNADFSQNGGMVEIGGEPWIIVEDIFTLTHFGVTFAPLKGAAALLWLKST